MVPEGILLRVPSAKDPSTSCPAGDEPAEDAEDAEVKRQELTLTQALMLRLMLCCGVLYCTMLSLRVFDFEIQVF